MPRPSRFNPEPDPAKRVITQEGVILDLQTIQDQEPLIRSGLSLTTLKPVEIASLSEGDDSGDRGAAVAAGLVIMGAATDAAIVFNLTRSSWVMFLAEVMGRVNGTPGQIGHFEIFLTLDGILVADAVAHAAVHEAVNTQGDGVDLGWSRTLHGLNFKQSSGTTVNADAPLAAGAHTLRLMWRQRPSHNASAFARHLNMKVFAIPEDWTTELV